VLHAEKMSKTRKNSLKRIVIKIKKLNLQLT
jgi:hypothetical protein